MEINDLTKKNKTRFQELKTLFYLKNQKSILIFYVAYG